MMIMNAAGANLSVSGANWGRGWRSTTRVLASSIISSASARQQANGQLDSTHTPSKSYTYAYHVTHTTVLRSIKEIKEFANSRALYVRDAYFS